MKARISEHKPTAFLAPRHFRPSLGDYASHPDQEIDNDTVGFIRTRSGLPPAQLAKMTGRPELDVRRVLGFLGAQPVARLAFSSDMLPNRIARWVVAPVSAPVTRRMRFSISMSMATDRLTARLGPVVTPAPTARLTMRDVVRGVAERRRISIDELLGDRRTREIAWARQEAMWLMHKQNRWSLPQMGQFLGGRDHTTVLHGIRRHQARLDAAAAEIAAE